MQNKNKKKSIKKKTSHSHTKKFMNKDKFSKNGTYL